MERQRILSQRMDVHLQLDVATVIMEITIRVETSGLFWVEKSTLQNCN